MANISNSVLLSKFRGCMLGALIGDCVGEQFELYVHGPRKISKVFFSNLLAGGSRKMFDCSDDTCMSLCVAKSLVEKKKVDPKDLAKRFVDEFYIRPNRGYGAHVTRVFATLRKTNFEDVFLPAKMQFNGGGSFGNGASMRIAPMALFDHNKTDDILQDDVKACSSITHTHPYGYNGAIVLCLAIKAALKSNSSEEIDPVDFISQLEKKMETIEQKGDSPYCKSLKKMKDIYLQNKENTSPEEMAMILGNTESAHESVPLAIYSFLRGLKPFPDYDCPNPFARTIYFAVSAGGDTDTIASMAGSIAGAYYGIEGVPVELQEICEFKDEVDDLAQKLYGVSQEGVSCNLE